MKFITDSAQALPINILLTQRKLPSAGASQRFLIEIYQGKSQGRRGIVRLTYALQD